MPNSLHLNIILSTYAISTYHHLRCEFESCSGEVYSIQQYVIKFASDLRQVGSFLRVLRFPPPIKLTTTIQGRIQDFKLGGAHLKKSRRAEGGAKNFGVLRVKNHDFTTKKAYFFLLRREARKFLGYFVWKISILRQKIIFFPILGGARAGCASPLDPPLHSDYLSSFLTIFRTAVVKIEKT